MSPLPCAKAVDETIRVYVFKWKTKKNPNNANPKPDQFRDPGSPCGCLNASTGMRPEGERVAGAVGWSEDWQSVLLNDSRGLHQVKSVCTLQAEAKQNGLKTGFHC